ncbi:FAD-binding protein [Sphingomonas panacisoli]|uniref:D-lactate dehydrogenase (cytochrome) n=2 Tax=Sphingomonas panacisoli TaxID=1813879 RepID=A0A5B8LLA8_9SPHN|nr:FAD-binding protein [Sphingomonas panacisoli]
MDELRGHVRGRVATDAATRDAHGRGEGLHETMAPDAVVFGEDSDDIATTIKFCAKAGVPVIPFGAGTSLEGQVQALRGGVCLDLSAMDRVLEVSVDDLDCRVEAGLTREALNAHLRDMGVFFPLDPGANATLGGMAATRASGTNAVRYGTMRDIVLGLTVVTPSGEIIRTGGRTRKSSAGYDLTRLYIGSEGTLGVITELQLKLFGIPEQISAGLCQFISLEDAVNAVIVILQMGIDVARVELLDDRQMRACIAYSRLAPLQPIPTLFLEFHGSPAIVADTTTHVRGILKANGGGALQLAHTEEDRNKLWKARHDAYWAARAIAPGFDGIATDACVPISKLAHCIREAKAEASASGLPHALVGHVGDGNFHMLILFDPKSADGRGRAEALALNIARRSIRHGGTCTGEHGIGLGKLEMLYEEHGESIEVMRQIKLALDPNNLMNPGKTIPLP